MRFDFGSFLIGFFVASLFYIVLFINRWRFSQLREWLGNRFDTLRQFLTSNTDVRYRRDLVAGMQKLHIAASILPLEDVLVTPHFLPDPLPLVSQDPNELYLQAVVPIPPETPFLAGVYQVDLLNLRDLGGTEGNIVLVGHPGSGKSTTLQHLAIETARQNNAIFKDNLFPVYVHLGDINLSAPSPGDYLPALIEACTRYVSGMSASSVPNYLRNQLRAGRTLILIDGLDELPTSRQQAAHAWILGLRNQFPDNRMVVASPFNAYQALLAEYFAPVYMAGWSQESAQLLVQQWVNAWEGVLKAQKRKSNKDTLDPALVAGWLVGSSVGRNPLELTLKIWSGLAGDAEGARAVDWMRTYVRRLQSSGEIPTALEEMAVQTLRNAEYGLTADQFKAIITEVSGVLPESQRSLADPLDLIDDISTRAGGLLSKRANGLLVISHPLVRAYLAARAMSLEGGMAAASLAQDFANVDWYPALPYFATLTDATAVAAAHLKQRVDVRYSALFMLATWLNDANPQHRWHSEVMRRLAQVMLTTHTPEELRGQALALLVATQDENVNKLLAQTLGSNDPIARQLASIGLGAIGEVKAVPKLIDLTRDSHRNVRFAASLALGLLGSDDALDALGSLLTDAEGDQPTMAALGLSLNRNEGYAMLRDGLSIESVRARRASALAMLRLRDQELPWLLDAVTERVMQDSDWMVRAQAETVLNALKSPPRQPPTIPNRPDQVDWLLSWYATKNRSVPAGEAGHKVLYEALNSSDTEVQIAAAEHLARLGDSTAIGYLQQLMTTEDSDLQRVVLRALMAIARAQRDHIFV